MFAQMSAKIESVHVPSREWVMVAWGHLFSEVLSRYCASEIVLVDKPLADRQVEKVMVSHGCAKGKPDFERT